MRELGITSPTVLRILYSKYHCPRCERYFSHPMEYLAPSGSRFTHRVRRCAMDLVMQDKFTLAEAARVMWMRHFVLVPPTTLSDWLVGENESANTEFSSVV